MNLGEFQDAAFAVGIQLGVGKEDDPNTMQRHYKLTWTRGNQRAEVREFAVAGEIVARVDEMDFLAHPLRSLFGSEIIDRIEAACAYIDRCRKDHAATALLMGGPADGTMIAVTVDPHGWPGGVWNIPQFEPIIWTAADQIAPSAPTRRHLTYRRGTLDPERGWRYEIEATQR